MPCSEELVRRFAPVVILGSLTLAACGESTAPAGEELGESRGPAHAALAFARNSWTPRAAGPFQGASPIEEFYGYSLAEAPKGAGQSIVYAIGGTYPERGGANNSGVVTYDPAADVWTRTSSTKVRTFYNNSLARIGNRIFITGGYNEPGTLPTFENRLRLYDFINDRLIQKASMPIYNAEGVSAVIGGKLYVMPGACSGDLYPNPGYCEKESTRRLFRYDPATNSWTTLRRAPNYHRLGAAAMLGGKLYVAGGIGDGSEPVAHLDVYDPKTDQWRTLAPLPTPGAASGAMLQGRFFVVVGTATGARAYAYDPATNRWQAKASPDFQGSMVKVTIDGRPHLFMASGTRSALYTP